MSDVLVVNSGSSSVKYQLIDRDGKTRAQGLVERIGAGQGATEHTVLHHAAPGEPAPTITRQTHRGTPEIADHAAGFALMLAAFATHGPALDAVVAVGHRVVHGADEFVEPTIITDEVVRRIDTLSMLAPLHNPGAVQGIRAARDAFTQVPHVAVFDTAFHQTLRPEAYTYAIEADLARRHRVRRYGFHGTSHQYVSRRAAEELGRPIGDLRQLVLHLGNGASITAVAGGRSVETSMGMTPLEGLVMGTRSGDLDPAVPLHLARTAGLTTDDLDALLNASSGLYGLAGVSDMRDLIARRADGDAAAALAFDVYIHRLRGYLGAYLVHLGGVEVISFTAGVGENSAPVREAALAGMDDLGIRLDQKRNRAVVRGEVCRISADDSAVTVYVIPTDEEGEIARQTRAAVNPVP